MSLDVPMELPDDFEDLAEPDPRNPESPRLRLAEPDEDEDWSPLTQPDNPSWFYERYGWDSDRDDREPFDPPPIVIYPDHNFEFPPSSPDVEDVEDVDDDSPPTQITNKLLAFTF